MVDVVVEILLTNINTKSGNSNGRRRLLWKRNDERQRLIDELQWNLQQEGTTSSETTAKEDVSVVVTYTQSTTYHNRRDPTMGMNELLKLPLSTEAYREQYMLELKQRLDGYDDLALVPSISFPFDNAKSNEIHDNDEAGALSLGYIIGITCGGAALIILIAGFIYYKRKGNDTINADESDKPVEDDDMIVACCCCH